MSAVESSPYEEDEKPRTVFVGNVPKETSKREIETVFGEIGPLKRCYIQYPRGKQGGDLAIAYVTYALPQDAVTAVETLAKHKFGSQKVNLKLTKGRIEQSRPKISAPSSHFQQNNHDNNDSENPNRMPMGEPKVKGPRLKPINKKSRLIVRNLSFNASGENVREYFSQFGEIKDVNILKKSNGKLVGCCFVQYSNVPEAAKAIRELNMKPFLGRPIAIDWALPKKDFQNSQNIAANPSPTNDGIKIEVKIEEKSESDSDADFKSAKDNVPNMLRSSNKRRRDSDSDSEEEESDSDDAEEEIRVKVEQEKPPQKKVRIRSNDVQEGKTLFIRNLDFDVKDDDLRNFFQTYGELEYALICKDKLTEHPKGSGFVKYKDIEGARKCLGDFNEDPSKFQFNNRQCNVITAVSKDNLDHSDTKKTKEVSEKQTDKRNLYLAREGFVRPGSEAAVGVSAADMNLRATLNRTKKEMLKNLNVFISPTRLCIHNLPAKYTDKDLSALFLKYAGPGAALTEARVMKNLKNVSVVDTNTSKGYGFVNFTKAEDALTALRAINNNPKIFSAKKRPIVEFSLENKAALKAKEKRLLKSQEVLKEKILKDSENETETKKSKKKKKQKKKLIKAPKVVESSADEKASAEDSNVEYTGLKAKQGIKTVPRMKPKGKISRNSFKEKKKSKKATRKEKSLLKSLHNKKFNVKDDKVEKMIAKRKSVLEKAESVKLKKKWYSD